MPAISVRTSAAPDSRREGRGYSRSASGVLKLSRTEAFAKFVPMRALLSLALAATTAGAEVTVIRTPNGGIQPQAAADQAGRIHLVYFKGPARAGDLFYVHKDGKASEFS